MGPIYLNCGMIADLPINHHSCIKKIIDGSGIKSEGFIQNLNCLEHVYWWSGSKRSCSSPIM